MEDLRVEIVPKKILKETARDVSKDEFGEDLKNHMENMLKAMYANNGVGLAGPQVGDSRRILVADTRENFLGPLKMVNPIITDMSEDKATVEEGCLSTPGFFIDVERNTDITVQYKDTDGNSVEENFSGFAAAVIQHEVDHLNGVTILDKASRLKRDIYLRKVNKYKRKINRALKKMKSMTY